MLFDAGRSLCVPCAYVGSAVLGAHKSRAHARIHARNYTPFRLGRAVESKARSPPRRAVITELHGAHGGLRCC